MVLKCIRDSFVDDSRLVGTHRFVSKMTSSRWHLDGSFDDPKLNDNGIKLVIHLLNSVYNVYDSIVSQLLSFECRFSWKEWTSRRDFDADARFSLRILSKKSSNFTDTFIGV